MSAPYDDESRLADASADLHGELVARVAPLVQLSADDRERRAVEGVADLRTHGVVTDAEAGQLTTIVRALRVTEDTAQDNAERIAQIHRELAAGNASQAALAIAGIAANSSRRAAELVDEAGQGADIGDFSTVGECACAGGIVGATAGIPFGPAGVLAGALAGAAGGAIGGVIAEVLKS